MRVRVEIEDVKKMCIDTIKRSSGPGYWTEYTFIDGNEADTTIVVWHEDETIPEVPEDER